MNLYINAKEFKNDFFQDIFKKDLISVEEIADKMLELDDDVKEKDEKIEELEDEIKSLKQELHCAKMGFTEHDEDWRYL